MVHSTDSACSRGNRVPRQRSGGTASSRLRLRRIDVIFQSYPGTEADAAIQGLNYELTISGRSTTGVTGEDGKVVIRMPPSTSAQLEIMGTSYEIDITTTLYRETTIDGAQQRLNMLGYNAGAVTGTLDEQSEYALLNFQADNDPLRPDGLLNTETQDRLESKRNE